MRQSQCSEMHSGLIEFEQQVDQGWLAFNRFAEPGLNPPERLEQEPRPAPFTDSRAGDWFGHGWPRDQYSSASMIVMTRSVTEGSAGSGEWWVRVRS
jgi:hypothetical protein